MNYYSNVPSTTEDDLKNKLVRERRFKRLAYLEDLLRAFSPSERLLLYALTSALALSTLMLVISLNHRISVVIPAPGGTITEGLIGPVRFINPLLATNQSDQDISALVYSGLVRALPDGAIIPDLAASYQISQDGTVYTFKIRQDAQFQDGTALTSADVAFTVNSARKPELKSPRRADWEGVAVTTPDPQTVVFTLSHPYAPFIENVTLGILPAHLWQRIKPEEFPFSPLNTHPIGSGPFEVSRVHTDKSGSVTRYELVPFKQFVLSRPHLNALTFVVYADNGALIQAFNARETDAIAGVSPADISSLNRTDTHVLREALPRLFGVFFNQSHASVLADVSVRSALDAAIDKKALVQKVLNGYGVALDGPIPPGVLENTPSVPSQTLAAAQEQASTSEALAIDHIENARTILSNGGWKFNEESGAWEKNKQTLTFSLATADEPELLATANALSAAWRKLGISISLKIYPLSELNQSVIRQRAYDAILFGEVVGREGDLFAFWHSSQRNDPGLNLAMYANASTDALLSQARTETDGAKRAALYAQFATLVQKDHPAVFLYAPEFIYIVPNALNGVALDAMTSPSDRFWNAYQWYEHTQRVWTFLTK